MTSVFHRGHGRVLAKGLTAFGLTVGLALAAAAPAHAAARALETFDFWTAWADDSGGQTICYVSSTPQQLEPSSGVNHGTNRVLVTIRPHNRNEVSFMAGFPISDSSGSASATVDGQRYPLVTRGSDGWLASAEDEPGFVGAMRGGASLVTRITSQRGTNTVHTYSLRGVTAALNRAGEECPS